MSLSLSTLVTAVNAELENTVKRGAAEVNGDGDTNAFLLTPTGQSIVDDDIFAVAIDGTPTSAYEMDFATGICLMDAAPAADETVTFIFDYQTWPDSLVTQAVNASVDNLFPAFYAAGATTGTADGTTAEFELDEAVEFVQSIDTRTDSSSPWRAQNRARYTIFRDGLVPTIRFYAPPAVGDLRFHTISRPALADLPDRAADPIISYACWYLLVQKVAPRTRGDVAVVTQGTGTLSPRQMNDATQAFLMRYQFQLASVKSPPWSSR